MQPQPNNNLEPWEIENGNKPLTIHELGQIAVNKSNDTILKIKNYKEWKEWVQIARTCGYDP